MAISSPSENDVPPSTARRRSPQEERRRCPAGELCPETQRRPVSFRPETRVYLIPVHWEMPDECRVFVWYSPRELEGLTKDVRKTVRHMRRRLRDRSSSAGASLSSGFGSIEAPIPEDEDEEEEERASGVCKRGLEHLQSSAHMEQRKINRDCSQLAVFDEQARQKEAGIDDPEELRSASLSGSEWSKKTALKMARGDEEVARRIHRSSAGAGFSSSAGAGGNFRDGSTPPMRRRHTTTIIPQCSRPAPSAVTEGVDVPNDEILQRAMELCIATDSAHPFCRRPSKRLSRSSSSTSATSASSRSKSMSPPRALQIAPGPADAKTPQAAYRCLRRTFSDRKSNGATMVPPTQTIFQRGGLAQRERSSSSLSAGKRLLSGTSAFINKRGDAASSNAGAGNIRSGMLTMINNGMQSGGLNASGER